jgi:hypothetical protein
VSNNDVNLKQKVYLVIQSFPFFQKNIKKKLLFRIIFVGLLWCNPEPKKSSYPIGYPRQN